MLAQSFRPLYHQSMRSLISRDAEPEPPEPTHFGRSRSRSRRNGLLGDGAGAGAVKNGAAPAPKRDTIVAKKTAAKEKGTAELRICLDLSSITRTSAMNYLKIKIFLTDKSMHLI